MARGLRLAAYVQSLLTTSLVFTVIVVSGSAHGEVRTYHPPDINSKCLTEWDYVEAGRLIPDTTELDTLRGVVRSVGVSRFRLNIEDRDVELAYSEIAYLRVSPSLNHLLTHTPPERKSKVGFSPTRLGLKMLTGAAGGTILGFVGVGAGAAIENLEDAKTTTAALEAPCWARWSGIRQVWPWELLQLTTTINPAHRFWERSPEWVSESLPLINIRTHSLSRLPC